MRRAPSAPPRTGRRSRRCISPALCALVILCACANLSSGCRGKRVEPCPSDLEARFCSACLSKRYTQRIWCTYGLFAADTPVDLRDLRPFEALDDVDLAGNNVTDLGPLAEHPGLVRLNLLNTNVSDLRPIAGLHLLETLNLGNTQVASLEPLRTLPRLRVLSISGTKVTDLSPLSGLTGLRELHIDWTRAKDLEPLMALDKLEVLWVTKGAIPQGQLDKLRERNGHLKIRVHEPRWENGP